MGKARKNGIVADKKPRRGAPPPPPVIEADEFDDESVEFDDTDPHDDQARADHEFHHSPPNEEIDIFEECFRIAQQKGDTAQFRLYQNGKLLPTVDYPYDWDQLRAEHGPGHYKVVGIYAMTKSYIKSMQRVLAGGKPAPAPAAEVREHREPTHDPMSMFMMMQEKAEARAREERERAEIQRREDRERFEERMRQDADRQMKMMELLTENSKLQASNMQAQILASQEAARKSSEEMNKFLLAMLTKKEAPREDKQDPFMLIKMMDDARRDGEERALRVQEMMDLKIAEAKEEAARKDTKQPESLIQSIVKSVGPALAGLNQQPRQVVAPPQPRLQAVSAAAPQAPSQPQVVQVPQPRTAPAHDVVDASRVIPVAQPKAEAPSGAPSSFIPLRSPEVPLRATAPATPARALALELRAKIPSVVSGEVPFAELVGYCKSEMSAKGIPLENLRASVLDTDVAAVAKQMEIELSEARDWLDAFFGLVASDEVEEQIPTEDEASTQASDTEAG